MNIFTNFSLQNYEQDFYIQQVERRMSRLKGEINSEEKQALEVKIVELRKTMEERKSTLSLLEEQIKKLHVTHLSYAVSVS